MAFDESDPKVQWAVLGRKIELVLDSEAGQYLIARAHKTSEAAIEAMKTVDPTDTAKVAEIQRRLLFGEYFVAWLKEAVNAGRAAQDQIEEERGR